MWFANIFSHPERKPFHFLDGVIWSKFVFNFDEEPFIYFLFGSSVFRILSMKSLPNSTLWKVTPMFSPKSFVVLALTFRSLAHFELIVFMVWCKDSTSLFYMWLSSCHRTIYWKDFYAHIGWFWWLSQNSVNHRYAGLFLELSLLFQGSNFVPVLPCHDYHCFVVSLKLGNVSPPTLFFFFNIVLANPGPLWSHTNFRITLPILKIKSTSCLKKSK